MNVYEAHLRAEATLGGSRKGALRSQDSGGGEHWDCGIPWRMKGAPSVALTLSPFHWPMGWRWGEGCDFLLPRVSTGGQGLILSPPNMSYLNLPFTSPPPSAKPPCKVKLKVP